MNILIYNLLNKTNELKTLDKDYLECLYQYYEYGSKKFNYEISVSKNDFEKIINIMYDVLRFRIDEDEFRIVSEHYVTLLMADARDGYNVNVNWFIDHIWYLCVGISNSINTELYKDCILFIQQKLVKEFDIEEKFRKKLSRKVCTKILSKG